MTPEPVPAALKPVTDTVTTDGPALAATAVTFVAFDASLTVIVCGLEAEFVEPRTG